MRSWLVIPAMGVAATGAAVGLGVAPAAGLVGAALAAVCRVLGGDSPAALTGAVVAPLLAVASFADAGGALPRTAIALAAAGWTVTELARPAVGRSALVAVLPATVAAVLDPSWVALIAIAGVRLIKAPGPRPRWLVAVPVVGLVALGLAALAGTVWPALGVRWFGAVAHPISPAALAALAAATLGPLTAVAALAGLAVVVRARTAELALVAMIAGAVAVDLRAGAIGVATVGLAALLAGLAIGRLAAMIRVPSGQAVAGATAGLLVVLPPAWTAFERPPGAHSSQASR